MLHLLDEQRGKLEEFQPLGSPVTIYVCGITPYDTTHLGHAFTYLSFDVLIRYLEYRGHTVRYVQNVTDIDDDIIRKSKEVGENWRALGNRWTRHFIEDMQALNVRPPDVFPRATEVIPEMHEAVSTLVNKGLAYTSHGNVYYHVAADDAFGEVTHLPKEEWLPTANERGNFPDDPYKRDAIDFVLWQAQKPLEPAWPSPWGMGRPGWHIECSTMANIYLSDTIDIHGGGADLTFPHHECETAQARGVTGKDFFAQFWLHTAMVRYEGEKMSKSLGNLVWARDLLAEHTPDAVRILINSHPYHETWEYNESELAPANEMAARLLRAANAEGGQGETLDASNARDAFEQAMDDNLNTREAIRSLGHLADRVIQAAEQGQDVGAAQEVLRELSRVLGLRLGAEIEPHVIEIWEEHKKKFA